MIKLFVKALIIASSITGLRAGTVTLEKSLGIHDTPWMKTSTFSYATKNPTAWFELADQIIVDYDLLSVSGALIFKVSNSLLFSIFSGSPTNSSVLNSGIGPEGLFDFGGSNYITFFNSDTGNVLDSASTGTNLGNLPVRVNELGDPSFNLLQQENLAMALAYRKRKSTLGFQVAYGFSKNLEEFFGLAEETQELWKSQLRLNFGLKVENLSDLISFFDIALELKTFDLNNRYDGRVTTTTEKVSALVESAGAFEVQLMGRLGLKKSKSNFWIVYSSITAFDFSSTAQAKSSVQPFIIDTIDNFSRNGFNAALGISNRVKINKSVSFLIGSEARYSYNTLFYDGIDNGNSLLALQPLSGNYYSLKLPLILAFEAQVSKSWVFNLSLSQNIINIPQGEFVEELTEMFRSNQAIDRLTTLESSSRVVQGKSKTEMTLGLSWKISTIQIDWLTQLEIFREGPYFLSGESRKFSTSFGFRYSFSNLKDKIWKK